MSGPSGAGYSCTSAKVGLRAGAAPAACVSAWTKVVLPLPSSPLSHTTAPRGASRHRSRATASSSAWVWLATTPATGASAPPPAGGRARHAIPGRFELEDLVAQLGGELEIQLGCRLAHLLVEHG